jgi:hypothetical protein
MAAAHEAAASILRTAGIRIAWLDCSVPAAELDAAALRCGAELGPLDVVARIATSNERTPRGSLGDSIVDVERKEGSFATVYADRIQLLASAAATAPGALLGRTLAHELGHLLLGVAEHSNGGLMRAYWSADQLRHARSSDWVFSRAERATMFEQLAKRASRARVQAATTIAASEPVRSRGSCRVAVGERSTSAVASVED